MTITGINPIFEMLCRRCGKLVRTSKLLAIPERAWTRPYYLFCAHCGNYSAVFFRPAPEQPGSPTEQPVQPRLREQKIRVVGFAPYKESVHELNTRIDAEVPHGWTPTRIELLGISDQITKDFVFALYLEELPKDPDA